jgi:hypothetical protein
VDTTSESGGTISLYYQVDIYTNRATSTLKTKKVEVVDVVCTRFLARTSTTLALIFSSNHRIFEKSTTITFIFYRNNERIGYYCMHYADSNVAGVEKIESQKLTLAFMKAMNAHNEVEFPRS